MSDLLGVLGEVQQNGGLMLLAAYAVWTIRAHRDDFKNHGHDSTGKVFVKKRANEL